MSIQLPPLMRAHQCNIWDLEYRLLSSYASSMDDNASLDPLIVGLIADIAERFATHYVLDQEYCSSIVSRLPGCSTFASLKAEITASSNAPYSDKHTVLKELYTLAPSNRIASYIYRYCQVAIGSKGSSEALTARISPYIQERLSAISQRVFSFGIRSIHVAPYNSMSMGHLAFYGYAMKYAHKNNLELVCWVNPSLTCCPEFFTHILPKFPFCRVVSDLNALCCPGTSREVLATDRIFHFLYSSFLLENLQEEQEYCLAFSDYIEPRSRSEIVHCRSSLYKNDASDKNASVRNSDPSVLLRVLEEFPSPPETPTVFYSDQKMPNSPDMKVVVPNSPSARIEQMYTLITAQTLICGTSGMATMSIFGAANYWHHNSMSLLVKYPIPAIHLFSPKIIQPSTETILGGLSRRELCLALLDDWVLLNGQFCFHELSYDELLYEANLFRAIQKGLANNGAALDIIPLLMKHAGISSFSRKECSILKPRMVSGKSYHMIKYLLMHFPT
jgi:hypothetical protein